MPSSRELPFPDSLCHRCSAPPRYIEAKRATYILCPRIEKRYPEQPVRVCELFTAKTDGA